MSPSSFLLGAALLLVVRLPSVALGATYPVPPEGPRWISGDGNVSLLVGLTLQADGRYFGPHPGPNVVDQFLLRRVQPSLEGVLFKYVDFRIMPDFASSKVVLFDAYIDLNAFSGLRFRIGKFKVPVGLERLQWPSASLLFAERALPSNLAPDRDLGAQLWGEPFQGRISYALGVFNGIPDGALGDTALNGFKDVAARLFFQPFRGTQLTALAGLGAGAGGSWGIHKGTPANPFLPTYLTSGQNRFFAYQSNAAAGLALADGVNRRLAPQAFYNLGPFTALFEYIWTWQEIARGAAHDRVGARSWQIAAGYVLTGGRGGLNGVVPDHPLDPHAGTWGDVELVARYHSLRVDSIAFDDGFADPASAGGAMGIDVGLNWYLTRNVKLVLNYDHTDFESPGAFIHSENAWIGRAQVYF